MNTSIIKTQKAARSSRHDVVNPRPYSLNSIAGTKECSPITTARVVDSPKKRLGTSTRFRDRASLWKTAGEMAEWVATAAWTTS